MFVKIFDEELEEVCCYSENNEGANIGERSRKSNMRIIWSGAMIIIGEMWKRKLEDFNKIQFSLVESRFFFFF